MPVYIVRSRGNWRAWRGVASPLVPVDALRVDDETRCSDAAMMDVLFLLLLRILRILLLFLLLFSYPKQQQQPLVQLLYATMHRLLIVIGPYQAWTLDNCCLDSYIHAFIHMHTYIHTYIHTSFKELVKRAGQITWKRADLRWETIPNRGTHNRKGPMLFNGCASMRHHNHAAPHAAPL